MQPMGKTNRLPRFPRVCLSVFVCLLWGLSVSGPVAAQSLSVPRTAAGDPGLQGLWNHGTITPLERPADYGDRKLLTDERGCCAEFG